MCRKKKYYERESKKVDEKIASASFVDCFDKLQEGKVQKEIYL
jgi:hypothetical protein